MTRKPLSKKLRFTVFARDGFQCQYCGRNPPAVVLHCDHVVPVVDGGPDTEDNLITSCQDCNLGKAREPATRPLRPGVPERAEAIREAEEQLAEYRQLLRAREQRTDADVVAVHEHFSNLCWDIYGQEWTLNPGGLQSVRQWLRDWTVEDLNDALAIAIPRFKPSDRAMFAYVGGILRKWRTEGRR